MDGTPFGEQLSSVIVEHLTNHNNMEYTGTVTVGEQDQSQDVVFDTGSGWLTVGTQDCTGCWNGGDYDYSASNTSKIVDTYPPPLTYGSATLQGMYITDSVCLDDQCLPDFKFFGISS